MIDRLEIRSENHAPLPVTDTGYDVRYFGPADPPYTAEQLSEMVLVWLDEAATSQAWRDAEEKRRQYSLF